LKPKNSVHSFEPPKPRLRSLSHLLILGPLAGYHGHLSVTETPKTPLLGDRCAGNVKCSTKTPNITQKEHLLVSRTIRLQPGRRLRRECGDRVRVGLDDYVLDDLLFFGVEDFG